MRSIQSLTVVSKEVIVTLGFIAAITFAANLYIPFYPVPFTGQTMMIMLAVLYNRKIAAYATTGYVALGLAHFPVFAHFFAGNILLDPSAGYVIGFALATIMVSRIPKLSNMWALILVQTIIFACGITYLSSFVGFKHAIYFGGVVFIVPEIIKMFFALKIHKLIGKHA